MGGEMTTQLISNELRQLTEVMQTHQDAMALLERRLREHHSVSVHGGFEEFSRTVVDLAEAEVEMLSAQEKFFHSLAAAGVPADETLSSFAERLRPRERAGIEAQLVGHQEALRALVATAVDTYEDTESVLALVRPSYYSVSHKPTSEPSTGLHN